MPIAKTDQRGQVAKNKTIEEEINEFLEVWDCNALINFMSDVFPLLKLYDVTDDDDWVRDIVGKENTSKIRLIRTVYLISHAAEFHTGRLATTKVRFKNLWERMEKQGTINDEMV